MYAILPNCSRKTAPAWIYPLRTSLPDFVDDLSAKFLLVSPSFLLPSFSPLYVPIGLYFLYILHSAHVPSPKKWRIPT